MTVSAFGRWATTIRRCMPFAHLMSATFWNSGRNILMPISTHSTAIIAPLPKSSWRLASRASHRLEVLAFILIRRLRCGCGSLHPEAGNGTAINESRHGAALMRRQVKYGPHRQDRDRDRDYPKGGSARFSNRRGSPPQWKKPRSWRLIGASPAKLDGGPVPLGDPGRARPRWHVHIENKIFGCALSVR